MRLWYKPVLLSLLFAVNVNAEITVVPQQLIAGKEQVVNLQGSEAAKVKTVALMPSGPKPLLQEALNAQFNQPKRTLEYKGWQIRSEQDKQVVLTHAQQSAHYQLNVAVLDMLSQDNLLVLANANNGITLLDISQPQTPRWIGSHQNIGFVKRVIGADAGHVLALNAANVVFLLDIRNPVEPTVVNAWRSQTPVQNIAWSNKQLFAMSNDKLEVVDFKQIVPQISNQGMNFGQGVNYGGQRRVDIVDNIAYVADWFSGIHLYDINNPRRPMLLSSFHTPGSPKGITVRNDIAYVPDDDFGLQVIDVSNPLSPKLISHLQTNGLAYTPKLQGNWLYLSAHKGGFQIIDVSNPAQPKLVSDIDTPGKAWSLAIQGDTLFVADDRTGLLIFDVTNRAQPKQIGLFQPGGEVEEVIVRGNLAFVAFFEDGLYIVDISNPTQPKSISHIKLEGNTRGLELIGDKLYVSSWLAGVHVLDVSQVASPKVLGHFDTRGATWGSKFYKGNLYTMDWWGGISVLDVSDPAHLRLIGDYNHRGFVHDVTTAKGNYAFIAQGTNGLQIFDISTPLHPTWVTGFNFPGDAQKVVVSRDYAYLAMGDGGLAIAHVADVFNTRWISDTAIAGWAADLAVAEPYVWVNDKQQGILLLDASNPAQPVEIARITQTAQALVAHANSVIIASKRNLLRYKIDNTGQLSLQRSHTLTQPAQKMLWHDDRLYVAQGRTLQVFDPATLTLGQKTELPGEITGLNLTGSKLYVAQLYQVTVLDAFNLQLINQYPQLTQVGALVEHQGGLYMGGSSMLNEQRLLPDIAIQQQQFTLPATTPMGSYQILLTMENGQQQILPNPLQIATPKFNKPDISPEEYKAMLQQYKNSEQQK